MVKNDIYRQNVSRRVSFPIRAGQKSAFLYTEITSYRYINDDGLTAPRKWFQDNIETILGVYGKEHHISKEDIYCGKLPFSMRVSITSFLTCILSRWHAGYT